jgi:ElaB/YqjD/DUF883 family membrane-anchored ribosome-binding protein
VENGFSCRRGTAILVFYILPTQSFIVLMSTSSSSSGTHDAGHKELVAEANNLIDRLAKSKLGEEANIIAHKVKEGVETLKAKSAEAVETFKARSAEAVDVLKEKSEQAQEQVKAGVVATEEAIKDSPWAAVGIAAGVGVGVGLILGLLIRRD